MTVETLAAHPFAGALWPEHVARLAEMGSDVHFAPGDLIFHEGDHSSFFYLLVSGTVALEVLTPGRPLRIATLYGGEVLGWSSIAGDNGKQFQARALEPVQAVAFDGARLRHACAEDYSFGYAFMRAIVKVTGERLHAVQEHLVESYTPVKAR
jgi:CRP-like cAMP-binding protein